MKATRLLMAASALLALTGCWPLDEQEPACDRATAASVDSVKCAFGDGAACARLGTDSSTHTDADCQPSNP